MRRIFFVTSLILLLCRVAMAEEIKNYTLDISKVNQEASNLHVECSFSLDFQDKDSVFMNFGGGQEFSIDNFNINSGDFEYELQMSQTNHKLEPDLETMFLTTSIEYSYLSSTTVREIAAYGGDVSQFVPEAVAGELEAKMKAKRRV